MEITVGLPGVPVGRVRSQVERLKYVEGGPRVIVLTFTCVDPERSTVRLAIACAALCSWAPFPADKVCLWVGWTCIEWVCSNVNERARRACMRRQGAQE